MFEDEAGRGSALPGKAKADDATPSGRPHLTSLDDRIGAMHDGVGNGGSGDVQDARVVLLAGPCAGECIAEAERQEHGIHSLASETGNTEAKHEGGIAAGIEARIVGDHEAWQGKAISLASHGKILG